MKKYAKKGVSLILCVLLFVSVMGNTALATKKIGLNKTSVTLSVGESITLKLNGSSIKSAKSSNKKVASVNSKGKVTAKKKGKTTITITGKNKKKYKCKVSVKKTSDTKSYNAYKSIIKAEYNNCDDDIFMGEYWIFDINGDGVEELLLHTGGGEMDRKVQFYTIQKGKAMKIGETSGWHTEMGKNNKGKLIRYVWDYGGMYAYIVSYREKIEEKYIFEYFGNGDDYEKKLKKAGLSQSRLPSKRVNDYSLLKKHFA